MLGFADTRAAGGIGCDGGFSRSRPCHKFASIDDVYIRHKKNKNRPAVAERIAVRRVINQRTNERCRDCSWKSNKRTNDERCRDPRYCELLCNGESRLASATPLRPAVALIEEPHEARTPPSAVYCRLRRPSCQGRSPVCTRQRIGKQAREALPKKGAVTAVRHHLSQA